MKTTSKKQKFSGIQVLYDKEGKEYPVQLNIIQERDFNFHKIWFQHFVYGIEGIANQKLKLAFWVIENLSLDNQLIMTQRKISESTGMSIQTVNKTLKALCEADEKGFSFLQKIQSGVYRVNPNIIFKGSHNNRMGLCFEYVEASKANKEPEKPEDKTEEEYEKKRKKKIIEEVGEKDKKLKTTKKYAKVAI